MSQSDTKNSQKLSHSDVLVKYNGMQNVQIFIVRLEKIAMGIHGNQEIFTINKAEDVAKVLKERTNLTYTISVHKQQDTDAIRNSLGHLSSLTGALKIHEIFIGQDLVVKKKMLPNDPFYKAVLIKESAKKSAVTNILDDNGNDPD